MVEFSDFPVEIHQMIVEKCDFLSRFHLRSISKAMLQIVDSAKLYIPRLDIDVNRRLMCSVAVTSSWNKYKIEKSIEDLNSMELTAKWMGNVLKNAEIGVFMFMNRWPLAGQFLQKLIENLKSPLKVRQLDWIGKEFSNFFGKKYLKRVTFFDGDKSDFTGEFLEFLKNVDQVSIYFPIDVTEEYVLSMNSIAISLDSYNFTAEMINRLVEKFIIRGTIGSSFEIANEKVDFTGKIRIPDGFEEDPEYLGDYAMTVDGKKMVLDIGRIHVTFEISEVDDDDSDDSEFEIDSVGVAMTRLEV